MEISTQQVELLDQEWVHLIKYAKGIGLTLDELRVFFACNQDNGQD